MELNTLNDRLERHNLTIMLQSNGRYAIYRIERGTAAGSYDRYKRMERGSYGTLEEAALVATTEARRG